jgi:hypothetical protein
MCSKTEILSKLMPLGFVDTGKKGLGGNLRITHPKITTGSLYINNQYVSGTGRYANIQHKVSSSTYDHKGYPIWKDKNIQNLLAYLETAF